MVVNRLQKRFALYCPVPKACLTPRRCFPRPQNTSIHSQLGFTIRPTWRMAPMCRCRHCTGRHDAYLRFTLITNDGRSRYLTSQSLAWSDRYGGTYSPANWVDSFTFWAQDQEGDPSFGEQRQAAPLSGLCSEERVEGGELSHPWAPLRTHLEHWGSDRASLRCFVFLWNPSTVLVSKASRTHCPVLYWTWFSLSA